jgi:hypothetical protein
MYVMAYPGALFGNMSVCYGNDLPSTTTEADALSLFSAYTGPYSFSSPLFSHLIHLLPFHSPSLFLFSISPSLVFFYDEFRYEVFPDATPYPYVIHYPIITNNPIDRKTKKDEPTVRYYTMFEDDNLLQINSDEPPETSYLYWRRNFPFPPPPPCTLAASVSADGSGWESDSVYYQQYPIIVNYNLLFFIIFLNYFILFFKCFNFAYLFCFS